MPPRNLLSRIPWAPLVLLLACLLPWVGSRYYTFLGTEIAILGLFAVSLNLMLGTTGLVSFGHAAYFGIGAYACGILMKNGGVPFILAAPAAAVISGGFAALFGFFCVRLTKVYFSMLTLAFAQIVWAICLRWNDVTGGEQGIPSVPYPNLDWMSSLPGFDALRISDQFYLVTLAVVALALAALRRLTNSPFGRVLTTIRDNRERAAFIGVNVRAYELAAFVIAGSFAGLAGALYGIFSRGVFPNYVYWSKSAEVIIMTVLGGLQFFWGPVVGAFVLQMLSQQVTSHTEYWPFVLGVILLVLLFVFPGGIVGGLAAAWTRLRDRRGHGNA